MEQLDIDVVARTKSSKNGNRRARRDGQLPAVIYGAGKPPQPILIDRTLFGKMLHKLHSSTILNLKPDQGEAERTIIRDIQREPVRDEPIHVDFLRIRVDVPIVVDVPIHAVGGAPKGVREGGVLETLTRHISIKVLPLEVPASIDHDLSNLEIGDAVHVSDLKVPEGVEVLTAEDAAVFIIAAPKTAEAEPSRARRAPPPNSSAKPTRRARIDCRPRIAGHENDRRPG
jgi:large subunit ribosomal protein L25